jgi:hypothetical protein
MHLLRYFNRIPYIRLLAMAAIVLSLWLITGHQHHEIFLGAAAAPLRPFRGNARRRFNWAGAITYAAASTVSLKLPSVGYLGRIILQFTGTITTSGADTLTNRGPWNLISRMRVVATGGAAVIADLSGYGAYLVSMIQQNTWKPDAAGIGATTPDADIYVAPLASGANTWCLTYILPIAANMGSNSDFGLINLQSDEVNVNVELTFGQLTDPGALVTATTGTVDVYVDYFEAPDPNLVALPELVVCRLVEESLNITGTGDTKYKIPRGGVLMQLLEVVQLNSSRNSSSVDEFSLLVNTNDYIARRKRRAVRIEQRFVSGTDFPTGVFLWDFFRSQEVQSEGDQRDMIDTEAVVTLEAITSIASGATLGTNASKLDMIRRVYQYLQAA